jgi:PAS domain-containing protein
VFQVNKLAAARRQLETAIQLYFEYGDELSIHALVGAAYAILRDINEYRGGETMLKDLQRLLDQPLAKEFRSLINLPENFLKHADKDPDAIYVLDCRWTEVMMWEASRKYCALTGETRPLMVCFVLWFLTHHPEAREAAEDQLASTDLQQLFQFKTALNHVTSDRRKFLADFLPTRTDHGI